MDAAYDHIQEEVYSPKEGDDQPREEEGSLNAEFQEAYKSFSATPWGAKLGGFFGSVKKQGESYYEGARQEATSAGGEAMKGFTDLKSTIISRTRSLSLNQSPPASPVDPPSNGIEGKTKDPQELSNKIRTESEALRESEGLIARFRTEATKRLKDIEKAEDAADEALLRFGTNIRNFLRDAVTIAPPTDDKDPDGNDRILFESKDQEGKRVIHTTRFDAQLHAIHSSYDSFTKDPASAEYTKWKDEFSVEKKTDDIAQDLEKYTELRRAMEKLVPEKVEYSNFWRRYYFLRMVVETEEQRRREMLKGATTSTAEEEEVAWDEDSDTEPSTPNPPPPPPPTNESTTASPKLPSNELYQNPPPSSLSSTTTIIQPSQAVPTGSTADTTLAPKANEPRRSQDQHSQPDSDASYDLVSGATSRAPGSPKDEKEKEKGAGKKADQEEEEEDWE